MFIEDRRQESNEVIPAGFSHSWEQADDVPGEWEQSEQWEQLVIPGLSDGWLDFEEGVL